MQFSEDYNKTVEDKNGMELQGEREKLALRSSTVLMDVLGVSETEIPTFRSH